MSEAFVNSFIDIIKLTPKETVNIIKKICENILCTDDKGNIISIHNMLEKRKILKNTLMSLPDNVGLVQLPVLHISSGSYGAVFRYDNLAVKFIIRECKNQFHEMYIPQKLHSILSRYNNNLENSINLPLYISEINDNCHTYLENHYMIHATLIVLYKHIFDDEYRFISLFDEIQDKSRIYDYYKSYSKNKNFIIQFSYLFEVYVENVAVSLIYNFDNYIHFMKHKQDKYVIMVSNVAISNSYTLRLNKKGKEYMVSNMGDIAYTVDRLYVRKLVLQMLLILLFSNIEGVFFYHNDLKPNNILVFYNNEINHKLIKYKNYIIDTSKENYNFKLNDFDFSYISDVHNCKLTSNMTKNLTIYHDLFYFFYTIIEFFFTFLNKYDSNLYRYLKSFVSVDKKHISNGKYIGRKKFGIVDLENIIFESTLFDKWIIKKMIL